MKKKKIFHVHKKINLSKKNFLLQWHKPQYNKSTYNTYFLGQYILTYIRRSKRGMKNLLFTPGGMPLCLAFPSGRHTSEIKKKNKEKKEKKKKKTTARATWFLHLNLGRYVFFWDPLGSLMNDIKLITLQEKSQFKPHFLFLSLFQTDDFDEEKN